MLQSIKVGRAVGEIGVVLLLGLEMGHSPLRLFHDLVPPNEQFLAEIIPLPLIHERRFVKRSVALVLVQYCRTVLMRGHCNPLQNEASPCSRANLRAARITPNGGDSGFIRDRAPRRS